MLRASEPNRRSQESAVLPTSPTAPVDQVRVYLPRETLARLVELQARALTAGFRKPTYGDLICAAVSTVDAQQVIDLLGRNGS